MVFCSLSWPLRVLRCRQFLRTYGKTRKIAFLSVRLIFFEHFKSSLELLFYSKLKVWQIPEILSTLGAPYDKISLLWLLAKFRWKIFFSKFLKNQTFFWKIENFEKKKFQRNFAWSHRSDILSYGAPKVLKISGICHTFSLE